MRTANGGAPDGPSQTDLPSEPSLESQADQTTKAPAAQHCGSETRASAALLESVLGWLDDAKAEQVVSIDLKGKSSFGDFMVVASGRSERHVGAIADQLQRKLKGAGQSDVKVEGKGGCDWVLIDNGDIVVHVFRPEVREFYNLEKLWSAERPLEPTAH